MICVATATAQVTPSIRLSEPRRVVTVDAGFTAEHLIISKWERGYLLGFDIDRSIVLAVDSSGKLALRAHISPSDASHVFLNDLSVSPGGMFAVAFSAAASNGGPANFIAWLDHSGKTARLVRVSGTPHLVCFADDESLWAAVELKIPRYDILRHYDIGGRQIGSALSRTIFPAMSSPANAFPGERGSLAASHDRIGFLAPASRIWAEINYTGADLGHWTLPGHSAVFAHAFLSQSDEVYIHQQERADASNQIVKSYRFDKSSNELQEMDTSAIHLGRPAKLAGVDGDELVYQAASGPWLLKWSSGQTPSGSFKE